MDGVYNALVSTQHIRVLTLAPSEDVDAALRCSLDQQRIDDSKTEYEAISYTWGDQERSQPLRCNGTIINITPNLASALLCLRSQTSPRRLWADAICINQDDLDEKSQQIPLMARIFRSATQVRVWLGNGDEGESRAIDDLASIAKVSRPTGPSLNLLDDKMWQSETDQALIAMGRSAKKVFRMPWFGRRWIVQELVLNGDVMFHCGQSKISWPNLHFAVQALPASVWGEDLDIQIRRKLRQFGNLWKTWCFSHDSATDGGVYNLLHSFQDLECKELKDRLYAIAGLASDVDLKLQPSTSRSNVASIVPSYDPMVSDEEVFQNFAFKMIQSGKVFSTLAHAGASSIVEAEQPLPSWVPDVRQPRSWPLIATENESEFKLVEVCEPSDGILALNIEAFVWGFDLSRDQKSGPICYPISIEDVMGPPKHQGAQGHLNSIGDTIARWLGSEFARTNFHPDFPRGNHNLVSHMLWSIIRSQLLTEDGCEAFDRLPSLEEWRKQYQGARDGRSELDDQWYPYLTKALTTRTIYTTQNRRPSSVISMSYFFGFGPLGLAPDDQVFIPFLDSQGTTALYLRPRGTEHKVLGGGLVWMVHRTQIAYAQRKLVAAVRCEVKICLI